MNKILGFFRKAETIYLRILWGILLYLVVCMLLNYSDCPSALVVLIPFFFVYVFIKKSRMLATVGGIGVGLASMIMKYGLDGITVMFNDYCTENSEAISALIIIIGIWWYIMRKCGKTR